MRKLVVIYAICLVPYHCFSTCIYIVKTGNAIYAAADSRSNYYNALDPKSPKKQLSICKIHHLGDIFFAVAGHGDNILTAECYNALKRDLDVTDAMNLFGNAMCKNYTDVMIREKKQNPRNYSYYLKNELAGVAFFGFKNGVPYLYVVEFYLHDQNRKGGYFISYAVRSAPEVELGLHEHLDRLTQAQYDQLRSPNGIVYDLENAIRFEIKYHPDDIAEPIDLLEITSNGANWIRKKKECN